MEQNRGPLDRRDCSLSTPLTKEPVYWCLSQGQALARTGRSPLTYPSQRRSMFQTGDALFLRSLLPLLLWMPTVCFSPVGGSCLYKREPLFNSWLQSFSAHEPAALLLCTLNTLGWYSWMHQMWMTLHRWSRRSLQSQLGCKSANWANPGVCSGVHECSRITLKGTNSHEKCRVANLLETWSSVTTAAHQSGLWNNHSYSIMK